MATSSNSRSYPYPSEFEVKDFVPDKLSQNNYFEWRKLMLNFIESRGLLGFINSEVIALSDENTEEYNSWKRSDSLVRGWIMTTLNKDTLKLVMQSKTSEAVWMHLKKRFDPSEVPFDLEEGAEQLITKYRPLYIAAIRGDWESASRIIEQDPEAVRIPITPDWQTALDVAVQSSSPQGNHFVEKLVEKMTPQDLVDLRDDNGHTALHYAVNAGNMKAAKLLVNINSNLPNVSNHNGEIPLNYAATIANREMVLYLWGVTQQDVKLNIQVGHPLLRILTGAQLYDIALMILQCKPELALIEPSLLNTIVGAYSSFRSGIFLNSWQNLIYSSVPVESKSIANQNRGGDISVNRRLHAMFWEVTEKFVPQMKYIREKKLKHQQALELVKFLCTEVGKSNYSIATRIFQPVLWRAIYVGIQEIVEEIIASFPDVANRFNPHNQSIFQYAIVLRRERVFNIIYQVRIKWLFLAFSDTSGNNALHLVGCLGPQQQFRLRSSTVGAALQMQRELQWFKEVEKLLLPRYKEVRNDDGMTPSEVFTDSHQELVKEGERWMKDAATSCTIVAALIATVVFSAAITVPGGNNNDSGHPFFSKQKAFIIFGISDALALFSSIASVLMFLSILTSRFAEEDFLYALPNRLIIGLVTLFFSILSTMIAFGATLYLVFGDNKAWILIPVVALGCLPVALFGALQFPLLLEMIKSTYGPGIFGNKQSDRILF